MSLYGWNGRRSRWPARAAAIAAALLTSQICGASETEASGGPLPPATPEVTAGVDLSACLPDEKTRDAYGIHLGNQHMGWALFEFEVGRYAEQPAAIGRFEAELAMDLDGIPSRMRIEQSSIYAARGEGELFFSRESLDDDGAVTRISAERAGGGFRVRHESGGISREAMTPLPQHSYRQECEFAEWLEGPPEVGAQLRQLELDLESALDGSPGIDAEVTYTYEGRREVIWQGAPLSVALLRMTDATSETQMEVLPDGTLLSFEMGPFQLRLQDEALARRHGVAQIEPWTHIPSGDSGVDPRRLESLTVTLSQLGGLEIPATHYQRLTPGADRVVVEIRRDHRQAQAAPLSAAARAGFLRATPRSRSDHAEIQRISREAVAGARDPVLAASRIQQWVHGSVRYGRGHDASNALAVLERGRGDCSELALLFVGLARAAGVPAREVGGLIFVPDPVPGFSWHAWSEIHDGSQWVTVDPSWNEVYVNAGHLRIWEDAGDARWAELLGRLEIEVTGLELASRERAATARP